MYEYFFGVFPGFLSTMIFLWWVLVVIRLVSGNTETLLVYADPAYEMLKYEDTDSSAKMTIPCYLNFSQAFQVDKENFLYASFQHKDNYFANSEFLRPIKTVHRLSVSKGSTYSVSLCWSAIFPFDFDLSFAVLDNHGVFLDPVSQLEIQNFTVDTTIETLHKASSGIYLVVEAKPNYFALVDSDFQKYLNEVQYQIIIEKSVLVPGLTKRILKLAAKIAVFAVIALCIAAKMSRWLEQVAQAPVKSRKS